MSRGGSSRGGGDRLAFFASQKTLKPFVSNGLIEVTAEPVRFRTLRGALAYGYEATVLADLCDAILEARKVGALQKQQEHIAEQASMSCWRSAVAELPKTRWRVTCKKCK